VTRPRAGGVHDQVRVDVALLARAVIADTDAGDGLARHFHGDDFVIRQRARHS